MTYNTLNSDTITGLEYYIDDLNTRFTNLLFKDEGKTIRISGLAFLNIDGNIPQVRDSNNEYKDALFDDNYDLTLFYIETGNRTSINGGFEASVDLIVQANMNKFVAGTYQGNTIPAYQEEDIINEVYKIMIVTQFRTDGIARNFEALAGFEFRNKVSDSIAPYFVFRIKTKLTAVYK